MGTRIVRELPALVAKRDNMVEDELEPEKRVKWKIFDVSKFCTVLSPLLHSLVSAKC